MNDSQDLACDVVVPPGELLYPISPTCGSERGQQYSSQSELSFYSSPCASTTNATDNSTLTVESNAAAVLNDPREMLGWASGEWVDWDSEHSEGHHSAVNSIFSTPQRASFRGVAGDALEDGVNGENVRHSSAQSSPVSALARGFARRRLLLRLLRGWRSSAARSLDVARFQNRKQHCWMVNALSFIMLLLFVCRHLRAFVLTHTHTRTPCSLSAYTRLLLFSAGRSGLRRPIR